MKKRYKFAQKIVNNLRCTKNPNKDIDTFSWYGTGFFYINLKCKENLVLELVVKNSLQTDMRVRIKYISGKWHLVDWLGA